MIFPWQHKVWQSLWQAVSANRLPHALLLTGMPGIGKSQFAERFTAALLCAQSTETNPNTECDCKPCRLVKQHAHPNVLRIEPEKAGAAIKVDQIREITEFTNQTSLQQGVRIVLINPANAMNTNAANALLKTLEEPCDNVILILISSQLTGLPATILSRCQRIGLPTPSREESVAWLGNHIHESDSHLHLLLDLAYGAPLTALRLMEEDIVSTRQRLFNALHSLTNQTDILKLANEIKEVELLPLLNFTISWLMDLLRLQLGEEQENITNKDIANELIQVKQKTSVKKSMELLNYLHELYNQVQVGINLNKQLTIETILIRCQHVFS